jgi:glycosyltransferase involved in cell wall biosynthesis
MKIGIDISRIAASARTGTEHYSYELLSALAAIDWRNEYQLYCNRLPATLPPLGTNFVLRSIRLPRLWTHLRLSAELASRPPDLLFVPAHVIPLGAPLLRRMRSVVTIHDLGYLHFPESHTRAQRRLLRLTTAWSARVASRVIAISQATKADLVRFAGVPANKISVVYHGVAPRFFGDSSPPGSPTSPRSPGSRTLVRPRTAPYFLYVGTIQPRKNLLRLIEAFALAAPLLGNQCLLIVGRRGWLSAPIEQRASELGIADRVLFPGYVADADLPALYAGATAFTFPSLYEGFGMPILEAMAAGVPVLTSTTSALPEVAGDAALLVDPLDTQAIADALIQLATNNDLRRDLHMRGLQRAQQFTWEQTAHATLAVFREAVA